MKKKVKVWHYIKVKKNMSMLISKYCQKCILMTKHVVGVQTKRILVVSNTQTIHEKGWPTGLSFKVGVV